MSESLSWRASARTVGYIDLIWTGLLFFLFFLIAVYTTGFTAGTDFHVFDHYVPFLTISLGTLWTLFGVSAIFYSIKMWAAIGLIRATDTNSLPNLAVRMAKIWRNVTFVFFVFFIVSVPVVIIFRANLLSISELRIVIVLSVVQATVWALFLFIVCQFIEERKLTIIGNTVLRSPYSVSFCR